MSVFTTNQNKPERIVRFIVSIFLIPAPFLMDYGTYAIILGIVGGILFFNAIFGTCMIYQMFGINTCSVN